MADRCAVVGLLLLVFCAGCNPGVTTQSDVRSQSSVGTAALTPDGTGGINHPAVRDRPYVVLVSFDGFRPDYLTRFETPNFDRIAESGVQAEGLIAVFPSLTFPSHYSIATGMYPAHHGIVGNRFFDPASGEEFNYRESEDAQDGAWWGGEPIWVTAERQGMVAAAFFFPGTEADIGGIRPTFWQPYDARVRNTARVDQLKAWLSLEPTTRPHLIILYFSLVDGAGHDLGPENPEIGRAVRQADGLVGRLLRAIQETAVHEDVYLLIVSDHGMATVRADRQIALPDLVDLRGITAVPAGPNMSLHLDGSRERARRIRDRVNASGQPATAFLRSEVPAHLHARTNPRFGDLLVIPDEGVLVGFRRNPSPPAGMHGWDPTLRSMHGILLARGPGLPAGHRMAAVESVHLYPLIAELLDLTPNPTINGDLSVWSGIVPAVP